MVTVRVPEPTYIPNYGEFILDFDINDSEIEDYVRELDRKAMVTVKFKANGVNYTRQYFQHFRSGSSYKNKRRQSRKNKSYGFS